MPQKQEVIQALQELLHTPEEFLVSVDVSADQTISVVIDAMKGVTIDRCVELTRAIEDRFDREEEDYALSVASHTLTDPLRVEGQYLKNIGNPISVVTLQGERYDAFLAAYQGGETPSITIEIPIYKALVKGRAPKEIKRETLILPLREIKSVRYRLDF